MMIKHLNIYGLNTWHIGEVDDLGDGIEALDFVMPRFLE